MKVTLASTSKFKNQILDTVKLKHYQVECDFEEKSDNTNNVYDYVKDLAFGKANSVIDKVDSGIIIGLDTVVLAQGRILEKPKNIEQAKEFLSMSSANTTSVITGVCIINKDTKEVIKDFSETKITLGEISEEEIDYYIENEPGALYASGFIVETVVSNFLKKIEGSYYNILGVPVEVIYSHIKKMGYNFCDLK